MEFRTARDLMIPLQDLPTVSPAASLGEVVRAMEEVQCPMGMRCSRHHWVMVGKGGAFDGWLGMTDVLASLDPRYHARKGAERISAEGVNPEQLRQLVESFGADQSPLGLICERATGVRAEDLMHRPTDDERIDADASIDEIVTRLVNEGHPMLLVTSGGQPVGVLRLEDTFEAVSEALRSCSA